MRGSCHCGRVSVEIQHAPEYINLCDCSLCRKLGGAWGYFSASEVSVSGTTGTYRREDYEKPAVEVHFCTHCSSTTHWFLTEHHEGDRMGVNMRMFSPDDITGIELRTLDGHNWFGEGAARHRRAVGHVNQDVFL